MYNGIYSIRDRRVTILDPIILLQCKEGNIDAFEQVFTTYKSLVFKTALLIVKTNVGADDVSQEVFLTLFKKISSWDETRPFKPWLYKIVVNKCYDYLRKQKLRNLIPFNWAEDTGQIFSDNQYEYGTSLDIDLKHDMTELVNKLPDKIRIVLVLRYYNDLKQEQISEILNVPIGTVKSRIHAGLAKIRKRIEFDTKHEDLYHWKEV